MMPWRRKVTLTTASPPARSSPRTVLPVLSLPSQAKTDSLTPLPLRAMSCSSFCLFVGTAQHFFQAGQPALDLDEAGLAQRAHALAFGLRGDLHRVPVRQDQRLDGRRDRHDLVDADAALVAGAVAPFAADRRVGLPAAVQFMLLE